MNASAITRRKLAGALATVATVAALAAPTALADPPNYQRHLPQAQSGLTHEPEIVSGLAASTEGRPAPQPEVTAGIASPGYQVLVSSATRPSQRGFDWADAGIGAAIGLAAAALASGLALALRKRVSLAH
jgi:hypothetical protein